MGESGGREEIDWLIVDWILECYCVCVCVCVCMCVCVLARVYVD